MGMSGLSLDGNSLPRLWFEPGHYVAAKGDLSGSLRFHAFAPVFLFAIVALILSVLLPKSILQPAIARAELIERKTGLTVLILGSLILYWLARLLFLQADFVQLIRG